MKILIGLWLILIPIMAFTKDIPSKEFCRLKECRRVHSKVGKRFWNGLIGFLLLAFLSVALILGTVPAGAVADKSRRCARSAEIAIRNKSKDDKEFGCSKFTLNTSPKIAEETAISPSAIEVFEVSAQCANPGVWVKYEVKTKKFGTKCKVLDSNVISRSAPLSL